MWKGDEYYYGVGTLRTIANNYDNIYQGISFLRIPIKKCELLLDDDIAENLVTDPWAIAEYKADFDMAWDALPRRMQLIVKYDIQGLADHEIERKGFYDIDKYKSIIYRKMTNHLNYGGDAQYVIQAWDLTNEKVVV